MSDRSIPRGSRARIGRVEGDLHAESGVELEAEDAPSLLAHVSTDEVSRFISPPPLTAEQFALASAAWDAFEAELASRQPSDRCEHGIVFGVMCHECRMCGVDR